MKKVLIYGLAIIMLWVSITLLVFQVTHRHYTQTECFFLIPKIITLQWGEL